MALGADVLAVRVQNGLYDVQPQTPALAVSRAAAVGLVEPFKQQRKLPRRDGLARVLHAHHRLAALLREPDAQHPALRAEFDGVIHQIIQHLLDAVAVGAGEQRPVGQVHAHL